MLIFSKNVIVKNKIKGSKFKNKCKALSYSYQNQQKIFNKGFQMSAIMNVMNLKNKIKKILPKNLKK